MKNGIFRRAPNQSGVVLARPQGEAGSSVAKPTTGPVKGKKGAASTTKSRRAKAGRRPKKPLRVILTDLLAKSRRPLLARELGEQAKAQGYETESEDFVRVIWVALGQMDNIENVPGQGYRLKKR